MRPIELAPVKHCLPVTGDWSWRYGTHTHRLTHTLYKHRKVLTPSSNLELQTITGLTVKKPKMKKRGHAVGCLGCWVFGGSDDGGVGRLTLLRNSCCGNKMFSKMLVKNYIVHIDLYWVIAQKQEQTPIHHAPSTVKHNFNGVIFSSSSPLTLNTHFDSSLLLSTGVHGGWVGVGEFITQCIPIEKL